MQVSIRNSFQPSLTISIYISDSTRGLNRLLHRLRPQLKSLLGADSRDEILTQLNAADEPRPDIGTSRPRNGITLLPFDANTTMCLGHPHPTTVAGIVAATIVIPPRSPPILPIPISYNTVQRKCLEIIQYRVKFSKSSISLSSRHGLRDDAEIQKGLTVMAVPDRRGYDPIKRRHPTTLDTLRTYDENSRSCSGFHSRQFRETDEDGG